MGTSVQPPKIRMIFHEVDFESSTSPAKSDPWNKPNWQCWAVFPTWDNIVCSHLCGKCMKSNELNVGHNLLSILWLIELVCSLTKECQVYQFVPSTSISRQFVSILLAIFQLVPVLLSWKDEYPSKDLRLCRTASSFCWPVRNPSQRTFPHVLPYRMTRRPCWHEVFPTLVIFHLLQQTSVRRTFFCIHQQCVASRLINSWFWSFSWAMTSRRALLLRLCEFWELRSSRPILAEPGSSAAKHATKKENTDKGENLWAWVHCPKKGNNNRATSNRKDSTCKQTPAMEEYAWAKDLEPTSFVGARRSRLSIDGSCIWSIETLVLESHPAQVALSYWS